MPAGIDAAQHPSTLAAVRDLVVLERLTIDDGNTAALYDGDDEYSVVLVVNEDTDETGVFTTDGGGNNAKQVDGGSDWGNSSTAQDNNLFHDGSDYVIENDTGSDGQSYTVVGVTEV